MTGQENIRPNGLIEHAPVTLRRFRAEDVDALFGAVTESLEHLRPWMPWAADYSRASAEEYLAGSIKGWDEGTEYNYAILTGAALTEAAVAGDAQAEAAVAGDAVARDAQAGRVLVGSIGLMTRCGPGGLEIGYWVHRAYTGRGLATAATAALVEEAFGLPGVDWVEIVHDELNVASGQIPRKLGFTEAERRPLDWPPPSGTGTGVVWRLKKASTDQVT
jgi:RimJ/RimL family protein N-acetyltransferase